MESKQNPGAWTIRTQALGGVVITIGRALAFIGCGGSGEGGRFSPHNTIRSSALSTYQTVATLSVYPIAALVASAPSGSNITAPPTSPPKLVVSPSALKIVRHTGLYSAGPVATSKGANFSYFIDSAGNIPAGSMVLISSTRSFDYPTYPATVDVAIKVNAGNLPCQGTAQVIFQGPSGASEIKGYLLLTKNHEAVSFDLILSSDHEVTEAIQIVQNGITFTATGLSGPLIGDQSMTFSLKPSGFAGTGTVDLISPTITLIFDDPDERAKYSGNA